VSVIIEICHDVLWYAGHSRLLRYKELFSMLSESFKGCYAVEIL